MNTYDVEELRSRLKDYYGTAAYAFGVNNNLGPMAELVNVDNLSDEEVINEAKELGII